MFATWLVITVVVLTVGAASVLKRFETDNWVSHTVSTLAVLAAAAGVVYATHQSASNSRAAIEAAAHQSVRDKKIETYVEFLAMTRAAFNVLPELSRFYTHSATGTVIPSSVPLGSPPPIDVMTTVSDAATGQESKYWLINAYDTSEPAHRTAWQLYAYVFCLNGALKSWDANARAAVNSEGDKRMAHLALLDYFDRRTTAVPRTAMNQHVDCAEDLPVSTTDALYGGAPQTKDPQRRPEVVISELENQIRDIAGVSRAN